MEASWVAPKDAPKAECSVVHSAGCWVDQTVVMWVRWMDVHSVGQRAVCSDVTMGACWAGLKAASMATTLADGMAHV